MTGLIVYMAAHLIVLDVAIFCVVISMAFKKNKIKKYATFDIQKGE